MKLMFFILSLGILAGKATPEMTSPSFWSESDKVIMTPDAIADYNAALKAEGDLDMVDIFAVPSVVSGRTVRESIESYSIPESYDYFDKSKVTQKKRDEILASRNLEAVPEEVFVRYGLVAVPADLRSFPTRVTCTDDGVMSGSLCFDDFQQTHLWLGEAVLVWHESLDGKWFFVRANNYAGWVEAANIALCSREEMSGYVRSSSFAVTLEQKYVQVAGRGMRLMMGTRFALDGSGAVLAPVRGLDGSLELRRCSVDIDMSVGYLPYTLANVMKQAFRLLGTPYSWGGAQGYNDCSATLLSVYYCFGIDLPRNSSSMVKMDVNNHGKGEMDFQSLQPGSLAIVPGHAMMFLGTVDGEAYILHDVNALYYPKKNGGLLKEQRSSTIISSTSDVFRKTGLSFLESFTNIIEVKR